MSLPLFCPHYTDPAHCFDNETRKPCTGLCGHTVCFDCVTVRGLSKCPVCELEGAFSKVSVNYASIALIEEYRMTFREKWKEWVDKKTPDTGFCLKLFEETQVLCSVCVEPVKVPRICLTCDRETLLKRNRYQWKQSNVIILELLQRVMCSNCAIDNHGEKHHQIVKLEMNEKSKKMITMVIAQKVLDMFKDAIENKKGVIDCFLRRLKIELIGQYVINMLGELECVEEWECGYLGELIKKELIKKYFENLDEKMLEMFSIQENVVCDCSKYHEKLKTFSRTFNEVEMHRLIGIKPQVFESGCPLYSWKYMDLERWRYSISEKESSGVAATIHPNVSTCPLCVYRGYSQHQRKDFLLKNEMSIIEEICKMEMIPLDKCCLSCLESLNDCQFLLSCENQKEMHGSSEHFTRWYHEIERFKKRKDCYQNCFMKHSSVWNFVIINHMMADTDLHEVIMHEIEHTVGFVDCQLQKVRMEETVDELYNGLHSVHLWGYFDHWSKPIEMDALLKSFKQQWTFFRFGSGEQEAALQCKCTVIWNNILEKKVEKEKYEDLESKMIDMARYSMTEEIHGCPMEYSHGIELNKDVMETPDDTVGLLSEELTLAENEEFKCLMEKITSNVFPPADFYCQNEEEQLFDNNVHQPYIGACGRTICSQCVEETLNENCPVCWKKGSFEGYQRNDVLLGEIETIKQNAWEMFKELWNNEGRTRMKSTAEVLKLSRHALCQGCASAHMNARENVNSNSFEENYLKKTNGIFLLKLLEDNNREGENCEGRQTVIQKNRIQLLKVLEEFNCQNKNACGYDRDLIKTKLIKKLIENIDQSKKQLFMPKENPYESIKEESCPMCVMIDFLDCAKKQNQNKWMNVIEHLSSNELSKFEKCCIRCLLYLNNRHSASCHTKTEVVNIKRMGNAIGEGIERGQLRNFKLILAITHCNDQNRCINDMRIWQNLMIREYFFCLLQTITVGLSKTTFPCRLQKIRYHNWTYHFLSEVCDVWHMNNQYWLVCWKFIKTSSMLEDLNLRFKKLRDEMDKKETGVKCECTIIWERNQKMMKKFGHENCEEKRKYHDLEDSMEEMARFSLDKDLDGCPMDYDHGFVLDTEIVNKVRESTDLEAETDGNKCLCLQIDSLGPNSNLSEADLHQIVSLFIIWWKYESSYPHLLCHVCIDRLELIQESFWALVDSNKCSWRVPEKFSELCTSIHDFQITKGRVFKRDMEEMTNVFYDFISEWDSLLMPPISLSTLW